MDGTRAVQDVDATGDGVVDWQEIHLYDSDNNRTLSERHYRVEGMRDERWTYERDRRGLLVQASLDEGMDGTLDRIYRYTYDEDGHRLSAAVDLGADGTIDSRASYSNDPRGHCLVEDLDRDGDGAIDSRFIYTYDEEGNRLSQEYDLGPDGTIDRRCEYHPACPPPHVDCGEPACEWVGVPELQR